MLALCLGAHSAGGTWHDGLVGSRQAAAHDITAGGIALMTWLGPGARLAGVRAFHVKSTCVAVILILVAFGGMFRIDAGAAVGVAVVVAAIVVGAVVDVPVLLAVEIYGLQGLSLHGGWTLWHHRHHMWLLLRGGCELDLLGVS